MLHGLRDAPLAARGSAPGGLRPAFGLAEADRLAVDLVGGGARAAAEVELDEPGTRSYE
jgi:hypothetical protein